MIGQGVTTAILLILLWPMAEAWLTATDSLLEAAIAQLEQLHGLWERIPAWDTAVWEQLPATSPLEIPTEQWLWLIGLASLAWLVGNGLLLNPKGRQPTI